MSKAINTRVLRRNRYCGLQHSKLNHAVRNFTACIKLINNAWISCVCQFIIFVLIFICILLFKILTFIKIGNGVF